MQGLAYDTLWENERPYAASELIAGLDPSSTVSLDNITDSGLVAGSITYNEGNGASQTSQRATRGKQQAAAGGQPNDPTPTPTPTPHAAIGSPVTLTV